MTAGRAGARFTGEGEQGGDDQQRLQALAEQNKEARRERGGGAQAVAAERVLGGGQAVAGLGHSGVHRGGCLALFDRLAHRHETALGGAHQVAVHRRKLLLDHLEAVQVGRQRGGAGRRPVAVRVQAGRLAQLGVTDFDKPVLAEQRFGITAQVAHGLDRRRADLVAHVRRGLADHGVQGHIGFQARRAAQGLFAGAGFLVGHRLAAHVERQSPALRVAELVVVGGHAGAVHTAGDGGVEPQHGAAHVAGALMEIGGGRLQCRAGGAVAAPLVAVAGGTMGLVKLLGLGHVRRGLGNHRQTVHRHQGAADFLRQRLNARFRRLVVDGGLQLLRLVGQPLLAFHVFQGGDALAQQAGELVHLGVFRLADDFTVLHRVNVVRADVLHQLHQGGLVRGPGGGGQHEKAQQQKNAQGAPLDENHGSGFQRLKVNNSYLCSLSRPAVSKGFTQP